MKIQVYGEVIECGAVVKTADSIEIFDENGDVLQKDFGIRDFSGYVMVEGEWIDKTMIPTETEQLRADVDYIAMETGVEL